MAKTALDTSLAWNDVYTSHAHNFLTSTPHDQFYEGRPFLQWLRKNAMRTTGGAQIVVPLNHGGDPLGGSTTRGATINLTDHDPVTVARYGWAHYYEPVVVDAIDEFEASGADARLNLVQIKIQDAIQRIMDRISDHLLAATKADALDVNTISEAIPVDPAISGSAFGGVDPSVSTWWRSKTNSGGTTFSTGGEDAMRTMFNDVSRGSSKFLTPQTGLILTTQTIHEAYEDLMGARHEINTAANSGAGRTGDFGFGNVTYKGIPMAWDPSMATSQSGKMFFIDNRALCLVEAPGSFKMTPFESLIPAGRNARGAVITANVQLVAKERRGLGQISSIS